MTGQPRTSVPDGIEVADELIPSADGTAELFLRNKRASTRQSKGSLLLVHGATFPSISLFDADLGGPSFMDVLAEGGIDVWALDIRGYGGSTRPAAMEQDPSGRTPMARATEATDDVAVALAHIRRERSPAALGLLGMSWGGSVAGIHAAQDQRLDALALVAPLWLSSTPLRFDAGAPIGSHRVVDVAAYEQAWLGSAPEERREQLLPEGWFDRWRTITEATDAQAPDGRIRAPSGAVADVREHWTAASPLYDPALITAPTLIVRGSWDVDVRRDMALDLLDRLSAAASRAYLEVAEATHMILLEPTGRLAVAHIRQFLVESFEKATSMRQVGSAG